MVALFIQLINQSSPSFSRTRIIMEVSIAVPQTFSFKRTVLSHGWCGLLPFELDMNEWRLIRVLKPEGRQPITVIVTSDGVWLTESCATCGISSGWMMI
jgi:hypothetical protein